MGIYVVELGLLTIFNMSVLLFGKVSSLIYVHLFIL